MEGAQKSIYYTLAAGWRTPDGRFSVGGGLNLVQSNLSLVRARNFDGTDDLVRADGSIAEGRSLLEVDSLDLSASIGVMWKPTPCSRIGLSYHSQPGFGDMTFTGTLTNQFGDSAPTAIDVELRQQLPDGVRAGGVWRAATNVVLHAAFDWQRWSRFKNQCFVTPGAPGSTCDADADGLVVDSGPLVVNIPRAWQDTIGVRVGGTYEVSDALHLKGGLLYDSNAVPDATMDPALMDMAKVIPQLGVRYMTGKVTATATLGHVFYMDRTTAPRAVDPTGKNRNPDMAGDYSQAVTYVLLGVGVGM
ncbi:MAG: outer membrane protein transport protein [Myxococcales bacterium]|nr:outer membrane protein transport protein [Myxococcales bacterium]